MEERAEETVRAIKSRSIAEVLEEVEVLVDTHFFNEFSETKSSLFLKRVIANQGSIEMSLLKTWRTLNCNHEDDEVLTGDTGKPPLCWQEERSDHEEES